MKRKLISFLAIPILILFINGCGEDLMNLNSLSSMSAPTFYQTKADFDRALTACYSSVKSGLFCTDKAIWDCFADLGYTQHNNDGAQNIIKGEIAASSGGAISGLYSSCYSIIARQNIFLKNLAAYSGEDITDAVRKQYMAETMFIRAYMYFHLWQCYGDVPLVIEPLTVENMIQPKVPASQIYNQIISDLDYAIANCLTVNYMGSGGHITVSAAKGLKARVLMVQAYGSNGTPDLAILAQARDLCKDVWDNYGYQLSPAYGNLFRMNTQEGNKEIIWSVKYLGVNDGSGVDNLYGDWYDGSPWTRFVYEFENADGSTYVPSVAKDSKSRPLNVWANRDPRFAVSVFGDTILWPGGAKHTPSNSNFTGYGLRKFLTSETTPYTTASNSGQDIIQIRLADLMLYYAEAENEVNGPTTACYGAVNAVRARPTVHMPALPSGLDKAGMRAAIRHERIVELGFEGYRYFDIKRWHIASTALVNVPGATVAYVWNDKFYKWPIPQPQIDISAGILIQNPDY